MGLRGGSKSEMAGGIYWKNFCQMTCPQGGPNYTDIKRVLTGAFLDRAEVGGGREFE